MMEYSFIFPFFFIAIARLVFFFFSVAIIDTTLSVFLNSSFLSLSSNIRPNCIVTRRVVIHRIISSYDARENLENIQVYLYIFVCANHRVLRERKKRTFLTLALFLFCASVLLFHTLSQSQKQKIPFVSEK